MLDNYDDESQEPSGMQDEGQSEMPQDSSDSEPKTALVDSSLCPGMKVGDEFTVRVEKVLDSGEYMLSYPEGSKKESEPSMEEGMAPDSEVNSYMG